MPLNEVFQERFVQSLAGIGFAERYYGYHEKTRDRPAMQPCPHHEHVEAKLASTPFTFRYFKNERFFQHQETCTGHDFVLNVAALQHSYVELIFYDRTCAIGGTFHGLAEATRQLVDPSFQYDPPYPRLPFSNLDEMKECVTFGIALYEEMKGIILVHPDWFISVA